MPQMVHVLLADDSDYDSTSRFWVAGVFSDIDEAKQMAAEKEREFEVAKLAWDKHLSDFTKLFGQLGRDLVGVLHRRPTEKEIRAEAFRLLGEPPPYPAGHTYTVTSLPVNAFGKFHPES